MTEQELSNLLFSITGIKKGFLESYKNHIERCYIEMVFQITALKKGSFERLEHYIVRGLQAYATSKGLTKKKFFESDYEYENRCYKLLANMYSAYNYEELLIKVYSQKSTWTTYAQKAHIRAESRYPTREVLYHGNIRVVEIIDANAIRDGDLIRLHVKGYNNFKFGTVVVGRKYITENDTGIVEMCFDGGECHNCNLYAEWERIIL